MIIRRKLKVNEDKNNTSTEGYSFFSSDKNTKSNINIDDKLDLLNPANKVSFNNTQFNTVPFSLKSMQEFLTKWTIFKNRENNKDTTANNAINRNWEYLPTIFTTFSLFFTAVLLFSSKYHISSFIMISSKLALVTAILAMGSLIYKYFRSSIFYHDYTFQNTQLFSKYIIESADSNPEVQEYINEIFKPENKDFWIKQLTWYMQNTTEKDYDFDGVSFSRFHIPQAVETHYGTSQANLFILGLISHKNNLFMQRIKGILDEFK